MYNGELASYRMAIALLLLMAARWSQFHKGRSGLAEDPKKRGGVSFCELSFSLSSVRTSVVPEHATRKVTWGLIFSHSIVSAPSTSTPPPPMLWLSPLLDDPAATIDRLSAPPGQAPKTFRYRDRDERLTTESDSDDDDDRHPEASVPAVVDALGVVDDHC